jgi:hypothetical protein
MTTQEMTIGEQAEKITFRLWPPYTKRISEMAEAARLKPNQFARMATMAVADNGLLDLNNRLKCIEEVLIGLRMDLNRMLDAQNCRQHG